MFKNSSGQVRSGWLILLAVIAMFIFQGLFMIPGTLLISVIEMNQSGGTFEIDMMQALEEDPWFFLLAQGGGTIGGIVSTFFIWRLINKKPLTKLGFSGSIKDLGFGLFLGAASITVIFIFLLSTGNIQMLNSFLNPEITIFTFSFLILFILVGIFEEMFFRGYVMETMASRGNKKWVIYVISALIFSVAHGFNPNVSILGLINIMIVGLLFAYMFDATKSLLLPIGYHITWNYFQGNVFGFAVSGNAPQGIYNVDVSNGSELLTGGAFGLEGGVLTTILIIIGFIATNLYVKGKQGKVNREKLLGGG